MNSVLEIHMLDCERRGVLVLSDLSLHCASGEAVGIVGPNGSGKSTLLKVIAGLIKSRRGRVLLEGQDISMEPAHLRVRRGVVIVPQERGCFLRMRIRDQLLLAASRQGLWSDAQRAMLNLADQYGIHSLLDRQGFELSGGQRQLIAIVRAALQRPKLLLLDEPTTGLDASGVREVVDATRTLLSSMNGAVLVVEHRMSLFGEQIARVVRLNAPPLCH